MAPISRIEAKEESFCLSKRVIGNIMAETWYIAFIWIGLALLASYISIKTAISVAMVEIALGVIGGNFLNLQPTEWVNFLSSIGSVILTFLAGAEIDPHALKRQLKPASIIGIIGFLFPFIGAMLFTRYILGWEPNASKIAGLALSTTSVAVVYAVMVETGLNNTDFGKLILAACFITDLGTVVTLGILFAHYNIWLIAFLIVMGFGLVLIPKVIKPFFKKFEGHVSEPEMKLLLLILFGLGYFASKANSEAVLPAYLIGLICAGQLGQHRETMHHLRVVTFALLTPFYFLKAGALVKLSAIFKGALIICILLAVKMISKILGVYPATIVFKMKQRAAIYTTLLMSTGLTFGTISAMFGFSRGYITQFQYSALVTTVIASAIIPTLIAQSFFKPCAQDIK